MRTPDLNLPDFSTLTVSRMLQQVDTAIDELPDEPLVLIGSSLGGFVAIHAAAQRPDRVHRLVLLAPAIDFGGDRMRQLGNNDLADWKRFGRTTVFHYGYGRMMPVHYELYEDASHYNALDAMLPQPSSSSRASMTTRSIRRQWKRGPGAGRTSSSTCSTTIIS